MPPFARLSLKQQAMWVVACRAVGIAATLASNILAARLLGPAQFGTYLLVTVVIALGILLVLIAAGILLLAWQQLGAELTRAHGELRLASLFSGGQAGGPVSNVLLLGGLIAVAVLGGQLTAISASTITVASIAITCPL